MRAQTGEERAKKSPFARKSEGTAVGTGEKSRLIRRIQVTPDLSNVYLRRRRNKNCKDNRWMG